jgi:hypothetical protein
MKERFMKKTEEYLKANPVNPANFDEQRSLDLERVKIAKDIKKHFVDRISRVLVMVEPGRTRSSSLPLDHLDR